ncbi:hypothetical protein [Cellulomonas sp. P24]|uniref:hypothetical protein n=1 Tax=Cellulomonas sp. P24 TaxID=2885206 RepID=UPI00216ABEFE|nr:hypothetical protein [Cellulomonas sp. P24]MCR6492567.1 hypothetical protein [Cellulomonas sp. P24]
MRETRGATVRCLGVLFIGLVVLAGCGGSSGHGTLSGHLYVVGGPAPGTPRAVDGTVVATGPDGRHTATVGADGSYTMELAPGTYTVTGTSPQYGDGKSPCPANGTVAVVQSEVRTADAYCQMP